MRCLGMLKRNTPTMQSRDLRRREAWVVVQVLDKYRTILARLAVGSTTKERVRTLTGKYVQAYCVSSASDGQGDSSQLSKTRSADPS